MTSSVEHDADCKTTCTFGFKPSNNHGAIIQPSLRRKRPPGLSSFSARILALFLALGFSHTVVLAYEEKDEGGHVLLPGARPDGYSLEDMARLMGQFTTSGNDLRYYPATPFQILYTTATTGPPGLSIPCLNGGTGSLTSAATFL
jgi:hypothetical protein